MKNALAFATLASCVAALCHAAGPPVPANLLACSKMPDPMERVKCYDAQIEAMKAQAAAEPSPVAAAPVAPSPAVASAAAPQPRPASPSVPPPPAGETGSAAVAGAAPSTPAKSPEERFGSELLPPGERPTVSEKDSELISQITTLQLVRPNIVSVSLANGQVWLQEQADPKALFFRIGQGAHIQKGTLGSYHLWTADVGEKNWVRVRRVR